MLYHCLSFAIVPFLLCSFATSLLYLCSFIMNQIHYVGPPKHALGQHAGTLVREWTGGRGGGKEERSEEI